MNTITNNIKKFKSDITRLSSEEHVGLPVGKADHPVPTDSFVKKSSKSTTIDTRPIDKKSLKRNFDESNDSDNEDDDSINAGFENEMGKILEMYNSGMIKNVQSKKKRIEQYIAGTIKANQSKVTAVWSNQSENQKLLVNEMKEKVASLIGQWEADLSRMAKQEEKATKIFNQLIKFNQQNTVVMNDRFNSILQTHEMFCKKLEDQQNKSTSEFNQMQKDLKNELTSLQKKMIKDGEKEEVFKMKKTLQDMFIKE